MKASVLDLRKNMKNVLSAISRNERVSLTYRGKIKAEIVPTAHSQTKAKTSEQPAFGIWADRGDMADVNKTVRHLRRRRTF